MQRRQDFLTAAMLVHGVHKQIHCYGVQQKMFRYKFLIKQVNVLNKIFYNYLQDLSLHQSHI